MKYHIYYSKVYNCVYTYWSLFMVLVILWWIRSRQGAHSLLKLIRSAVLTLSTEIHPSIFCGSWWHPSIYWLELMKRTWHIVEIIKEVKLLTRFYLDLCSLPLFKNGVSNYLAGMRGTREMAFLLECSEFRFVFAWLW
jgi:hypothetical protein